MIYNEPDPSCSGVSIAPGEGKIPKPIPLDPDAEELAFPTIFAGKRRTFRAGLKVSLKARAKSAIAHHDRRCARPDYLLYLFERVFNEEVRNAFSIALRKKKGTG